MNEKTKEKKSLIESFESLSDPRDVNAVEHKLIDIVVIAILAILCGANGFNQCENFGKCKEQWLRKFLELPHGIPSHDTFDRVFSLLDNQKFST